MLNLIRDWFRRYFSDPEISVFWLFFFSIILAFVFFGRILTPVLISIGITYLLQWFVTRLQKFGLSHRWSVITVYVLFLTTVSTALLGLLPLLWRQLSTLINELPDTVGQGQAWLDRLSEKYPHLISPHQLKNLIDGIKGSFLSQNTLSASLSTIPDIITILVYFVLVPILVYFFLMDRQVFLNWINQYLPKRRRLIQNVWREVYSQLGHYVRGKILEIVIVAVACFIAFSILGLQYAILLSALVGLSAVIPYLGAVLVTIPVIAVGLVQWGLTPHFTYLVIIYTAITVLDANILVPLILSEAVNLHPVAIIVSILIFGGLWGFWGVFFAIPLATVVKAILHGLTQRTAAQDGQLEGQSR